MLQQQKLTFQMFFVIIYLPMFAQCDTWESLLLIILFRSDLLFHMCEQGDVLTWLVSSVENTDSQQHLELKDFSFYSTKKKEYNTSHSGKNEDFFLLLTWI